MRRPNRAGVRKRRLPCLSARVGVSAPLVRLVLAVLLGLWPLSARGLPGALRLAPDRLSLSPYPAIHVQPAEPGKNNVAYWSFDWRTHDFGVGVGGAGLRLFFDSRARRAASLAIPILGDTYLRLSRLFDYLPTRRIPFVLYATQSEFLATRVFALAEGTLGVTDPGDLRMAMPFFGDLPTFARVSAHEMAHQFTVQKVRDAAADVGAPNPIGHLPLWFIEGIAEWASLGGVDPETDAFLRDLVVNPDPTQGYALPDFFDDRARGYLGVYKLGQARVAFLAETFGAAKIREILERSPQLSRAPASVFELLAEKGAETPPTATEPPDTRRESPRDSADAEPDIAERLRESLPEGESSQDGLSEALDPTQALAKRPPRTFAEHVARVVGVPREVIEARYRTWMKRRYFRDFFETAHDIADFEIFSRLEGDPDALASSDDGALLLYRSVERGTGRGRLFVESPRDPRSRVLVARDGQPGVESLHPVNRRVAAIRGDKIAFIARDGPRDVIWVRRFTDNRRRVDGRARHEITLQAAERFTVPGVLEMLSPALSPDAQSLAFVGVGPDSFRDLYVLQLEGERRGEVRRLTDDVAAESDLFWQGPSLFFAADMAARGPFGLFALDVESGQRTLIATTPTLPRAPLPVATPSACEDSAACEDRPERRDLLFIATPADGRAEIWLSRAGRQRRLTELPFALIDLTPGENGTLVALGYWRGKTRAFAVTPRHFFDESLSPFTPAPPLPALDASPVLPLPEGDPVYAPFARENWRLEAGVGALVGGVSAGSASLVVTDLMRDHLVLLNLAIYGRVELTEALAWYVNQSRRLIWGIGVFHTFESRRDKTFPEVENYFAERHFGAAGFVRYPLDRFRFLEAGLQARGVDRFDFTDESGELQDAWRALNRGIEPEIVTSLQFALDTLVFDIGHGPIEGSVLSATFSAGALPLRRFGFLRLQIDASHRFRLVGRMNLFLRASLGLSTGGRFSPQFFLASIGNMEGFRFGDARLIGDDYGVLNARLSLPLDFLLQSPIFSSISAVAGLDFGTVFDAWPDAWQRRSLSAMLGIDASLGNLVFQFHFGRLIDTGNGLGGEGWVFNLDLAYFTF